MKILKNPIFRNYTSLTVNHGTHILINLLFIPLFLTFWNLETYADWILISTIPALLAFGEFGLASYGLNLIVILFKQNKKSKANYTLQNVIYFSTAIIFSLGLVLIMLNYIFDLESTFNINSTKKNEFYLIIIFIVFKYLLLTNSNFVNGLFRINNRYHLSVYLQTFFLSTEIVLIAITLALGGKILEVSFVGFINYVVAFVASCYLIKKEFIWLQIINFKNINLLFIKKIFYPSISFMTGNLCKAILINGTIIVLKIFSNDLFIVLYNSLRLIMNGARQFINILTISFQPQVTIDYAKNKLKKIIDTFKILFKYNFYLSTVIAIIFILFLKEPFLIWTKGSVDWNFNFFILFLIASYIEWLGIPILTIPYSINKAETLNKVYIISLIAYFVILASLFKHQAIIAIPIALLITNLYSYFYSWIILNKILILQKGNK